MAQLLQKVAALKGNIRQEIIDADLAYNVVLLGYLESESKANRAKIKAETTKEYLRKTEARNYLELAKDIEASLKYGLREAESEFRRLSNLI